MPPPDLLSWEFWVEALGFWAKDSESLYRLALIAAGLIGIPLLYSRTRSANRSARAALEQAKTAAERHDEQTNADQERRITESFAKAAELLGSNKRETRLGGIYTFERIAGESPREYWPIMETLTAFVRERAPWPPRQATTEQPNDLTEQTRSPTDIQAALIVLGRRNKTAPKQFHEERAAGRHLDLARTDLRRAYLRGANLEGADLSGTHLEGTSLWGAHLQGATLWGVHLQGTTLWGAHLEGAWLVEAHLKGAILREAHLEGANLAGADGLTQEQLNSASGNDRTALPAGLTRPAHWPAAAPEAPDTPHNVWWQL